MSYYDRTEPLPARDAHTDRQLANLGRDLTGEAFAAGVAMARDYIATCPYTDPALKRAWLEGIFSTIPCEAKS